jgi:hypothetical protein
MTPSEPVHVAFLGPKPSKMPNYSILMVFITFARFITVLTRILTGSVQVSRIKFLAISLISSRKMI